MRPSPVLLAALAAAAGPAAAEDLTAHGNEPFWSLTIADGRMQFTRAGDKGVTDVALPAAETVEGGTRYAADGLTVTVTGALCRDTMAGMLFPATVTVETEGQTLSGCGGEPRTLLTATDWRVTAMEGATVPEGLIEGGTLSFDDEGRVAGRAFCNRFTGPYTLTGEGLSFGPAAMTKMLCPDPLGALEFTMSGHMARVDRFDIADDGSLVLIGADTPLITAAPVPRPEP